MILTIAASTPPLSATYASVETLLNQSPLVASQPLEVKPMKKDQVIQSDPDVLSGTPVFAGTRVPIQTLVDHLKAGESLEDFLDGFPSVSRGQAEARLQISLDSALAEKDAHSA